MGVDHRRLARRARHARRLANSAPRVVRRLAEDTVARLEPLPDMWPYRDETDAELRERLKQVLSSHNRRAPVFGMSAIDVDSYDIDRNTGPYLDAIAQNNFGLARLRKGGNPNR